MLFVHVPVLFNFVRSVVALVINFIIGAVTECCFLFVITGDDSLMLCVLTAVMVLNPAVTIF